MSSKEREGGRVQRHYEVARTPYERILESTEISEHSKLTLIEQFRTQDPLSLLAEIEVLQNEFWLTAVAPVRQPRQMSTRAESLNQAMSIKELKPLRRRPRHQIRKQQTTLRSYPGLKKGRKSKLGEVWSEVCLLLEDNPRTSLIDLEKCLIERYPERFKPSQSRTLRNRVLCWQLEHGIVIDQPKGTPGRKSNINLIWQLAQKELEQDPFLSQRKLHLLMMEKYPDDVKPSQYSALAGRLKQWRMARYQNRETESSDLIVTIIESEQAQPIVTPVQDQ